MVLKSLRLMNVWWQNRLLIRFYQKQRKSEKQKAGEMRTRSDSYTFSHI